jgi:hypothetical protein
MERGVSCLVRGHRAKNAWHAQWLRPGNKATLQVEGGETGTVTYAKE